MKNVIRISVVLCGMFICSGSLLAQGEGDQELTKGLVDTVAQGCEKELNTYCKDVTPGESRILACLYAHGDKLSGQCEYALYDAAVQLERAVASWTYVANECAEDLEKYCIGIQAGEGRLLDCLSRNEDVLSDRCNQALKDTKLN